MPHFTDLNLNDKIVSALAKKGYVDPTPIQAKAIPHILEGKDLLGIAQTGTGKTAAFALPILDNLFKSSKPVLSNRVRALILTPTRELASQINDNIKLYGEDLHLKSGLIFGGVNINTQIANARKGFDILVATPGRLLDLMNKGHIRFADLEIFVLDEADRMLDMGFINDVRKIIAKLPSERQTLFFSATMPKDVAVLANSILKDPIKVEVTPAATTVERIDQSINFVEKANKPLLLKTIIKNSEDGDLFLVFSKTKHNANRIAAFLDQHAIKAMAIHGNKSQSAREKALDEFRNGKIKVLVATDIAARGIDISSITHVINYDLPNEPESYVHRIGRTGRAGRAGIAISFCDGSEKPFLKDIEKIIKMKIPVDENHPLSGVEASEFAANSLPSIKRGDSGRKPSTRSMPPTTSASRPGFKKKFNTGGKADRPLSYFAQSRQKDSNGRFVKQKSDGKFGDDRKPRSNSEGSSEKNFNIDRAPRNFEDKPRFGGSDSKPRFNPNGSAPRSNDRGSFSGERKPRFESSDRPSKPSFDRKPSDFGGREVGFGEKQIGSGQDRFKRSHDRPTFGNNSAGKFGDRKPRFEGRSDSSQNPYARDDRRSKFTSSTGSDSKFDKKSGGQSDRPSFGNSSSNNRSRDFGNKSANNSAGFGGRKFDGRNNGGRKPTK
ncbi:MAG: ATP-dependent RNA helicase RhlE [Rickettsiales bacterium]|jgi:ATP-dependent RNA helicase RhlE